MLHLATAVMDGRIMRKQQTNSAFKVAIMLVVNK